MPMKLSWTHFEEIADSLCDTMCNCLEGNACLRTIFNTKDDLALPFLVSGPLANDWDVRYRLGVSAVRRTLTRRFNFLCAAKYVMPAILRRGGQHPAAASASVTPGVPSALTKKIGISSCASVTEVL